MPHIVATISGHGFGHLSISAPILNELHRKFPSIDFTIVSGLPQQRIRTRVTAPFRYECSTLDFGVHMDQNLSVLINDTVAAYRSLHEHWSKQKTDYAEKLNRLNCDLLFSNIDYLSLAAASDSGIPSIALSPLNWADIYEYFCSQTEGFARIHEQMLAAYQSAKVFLKPAPSMPMLKLKNTQPIGSIAAKGSNLKPWLCDKLGLESSIKLVLVAMGGHELHIPVTWPTEDSIVWLVSRSWQAAQHNVVVLDDLGIHFLDLLATCDLLISKPGYGSFVEATYVRKPTLYVTRPDWPEESFLIHWLAQHNICGRLTFNSLHDGTFIHDVSEILQRSELVTQPSIANFSGLEQTVDVILNAMGLKNME